jgi:uncharacterized protein YukE
VKRSPLTYPEGSPERAEYDELMASPYVSPGTKASLEEAASADSFPGFLATEVGYDNVLRRASTEMQAGAVVENDAAKSRDELEQGRPPGPGGAGPVTSDEILDLARPTLDFLFQWINQVWNAAPPAAQGPIDFQQQIITAFDQNRGIDFRNFHDDASELANTHRVAQETVAAAQAELNTLFGDWKGQGAAAARVKLDEAILPDARKLLAHLEASAQAIPETLNAVYETLRQQVDEALRLIKPTIAQAPLSIARSIAAVAPGGPDHSEDDFAAATDFLARTWGIPIYPLLVNETFALGGGPQAAVAGLCQQWCEQFAVEFRPLVEAFQSLCKESNEAVDQLLYELSKTVGGYTNEFQGAAATGLTGAGSTPPPSVAGAPEGIAMAAPAIGGGAPATPPAATAAPVPPEIPPVSTTETPDLPGTTASAAAGSANPVTGEPLETDPETGEPYPIDPRTGAVTDDAGERETLTVTRGETELSLTEPDAEGRMGISIDDGSGAPQEYRLDFDGGEPIDDSARVEEGAAGETAAVRQVATGDEVHRPGPDGKIHIEDGGRVITAERPDGPDGPTVITVDDGSGDVATYTLGAQAAESSDTAPTPAGQTAQARATADAAVTVSDERHREDANSGVGETRGPAADAARQAERPVSPAQGDTPEAVRDALPADSAGPGTAGQPPAPQSLAAGTTVPAATADDLGVTFGGEDQADGGASSSGQPADHRQAQPAAGLGSAPGGRAAESGATGAAGAGMGMMGGGMGGATGGGGGGDQERNGGAYRIGGDLFGVSDGAARISGTLDGDTESVIRFER